MEEKPLNDSSEKPIGASALKLELINMLHPRYYDKASHFIDFMADYSHNVSFDPDNGEVILDGRRIKNSSLDALIHSLYEGKKRNMNLIGLGPFQKAVGKVSGKAGIKKLGSYISNREQIGKIQANQKGFSQSGQGNSLGKPFRRPKNNRLSKPPGKGIKALYLY